MAAELKILPQPSRGYCRKCGRARPMWALTWVYGNNRVSQHRYCNRCLPSRYRERAAPLLVAHVRRLQQEEGTSGE